MFKKILFTFLFFFSILNLFSQDYEPMLKQGSFWDVMHEVIVANWPSTATRYKISKDTIINNKTYKKIKKAPIRQSEENFYILNQNEETYVNLKEYRDSELYLREDIKEKKVYILAPFISGNIEYTYCDFSLNKGELMENGYTHKDNQSNLIIRDKIISNYNGKIEFVLGSFSFIEGIGKFQSPFETYDNVFSDTRSEIFCHGNDKDQNNCAKTINQDYEPMIKEGSFWDVNTSTPGECGHRNFRYKIGNDTIINNKTYKKLKGAEFETIEDNCPTYKFPLVLNPNNFGKSKFLFLREDVSEKKVYVWSFEEPSNQYKEFTLYDFSLSEGEVMTNAYFGDININGSNLTIGRIYLDRNGKKTFATNRGDYTEGIGGLSGLFQFNIYLNYGLNHTLFCWGNTQNQNSCAEVLSTKKEELSSVKLYPNPTEDFLTINSTENITIKIYSTTGALLKNIKLKKDFKIDVSSFKTGVYIFEISNSKGKKRSKFFKL
ncbi:MAG: T9SS type A sorting domain-containing protein [Polaribacter sp.]